MHQFSRKFSKIIFWSHKPPINLIAVNNKVKINSNGSLKLKPRMLYVYSHNSRMSSNIFSELNLGELF